MAKLHTGRRCCVLYTVLCLLPLLGSCATPTESLVREELESGMVYPQQQQRHLLQTVAACPIDFAAMNYSSITSVCNNSDPSVTLCCNSFTLFACNYASYINDATTNCATELFSYLTLAGNYSSGLFSSLCTGNADGLACPITPAPAPSLPSGAFLRRPWGGFTITALMFLVTLISILLSS